ncbi:MAG: hypothetical protein JKY81_04300 [Colwellia sp.]|nr:hypothetical protein [Colwellia sp.]
MIKIMIVVFFMLNVIACQPVQQEQVTEKKQPQQQYAFSCLTSQSQCDVATEFGHVNIEFSGQIAQGKIKTELPFHIQLHFDALNDSYKLQRVNSHLEGAEMFMGKIPVFFDVIEKGGTSYLAESLLANCMEDEMIWRLWFQLEFSVDNEIKQQDFFIDFVSLRL